MRVIKIMLNTKLMILKGVFIRKKLLTN